MDEGGVMGISKYAKATYGWMVNWDLIETETVTEVPTCSHQTVEKVPLSSTDFIIDLITPRDGERFCGVCGVKIGWKKEYSRSYTDIVEEVPEDYIDGFYVTCKGYPVYKKDKEYNDEPDLAFIGITIGEGEFVDLAVCPDIVDDLAPVLGKDGFGLHCWTEYA